MGEVADWLARHKGHQITHADVGPAEDVGPHTGAAPRKRPEPRGSRILHCHDCHVDIALYYVDDYKPGEWPPGVAR